MTAGQRVAVRFAARRRCVTRGGVVQQVRRNVDGSIHKLFVRTDDGRLFAVKPASVITEDIV